MGFQIIKIKNRCKLETQLNYLVCRSEKDIKVLLDDISVLIIENQQVCITSALISELINHKVRVVFCDEKHNPQSELVPQHGVHNTYERQNLQMGWEQSTKNLIWASIIKQKIHNQGLLTKYMGDSFTHDRISGFESEIVEGDATNREGLAAKAYFASLFGSGFDRRNKCKEENIYLNYGYSMILSERNREVSCAGYLDTWGIHHIGPDNPFNLGCDLMEPFRPFVDRLVATNGIEKNHYKSQLIDHLNSEVLCDGKVTIMANAIHNFASSVFSALNAKNPSLILKVTFLDEQL